MDIIDSILQKIEIFDGVFPQKELETIARNKEHAIPKLLRIMEDVRVNYETYVDKESMLNIYATYLLAEFRVKTFFPIFIDIAELPGEWTFYLYSDGVTEAFQRVMASVYDGNKDLLFGLIENPEVNVYVREQGIGALVILVLEGLLEREYIVSYLQRLLIKRGEEEEPEFVAALIYGLTELYPEESMDEIRWAFNTGLVPRYLMNFDTVLCRLEMGREAALADLKEDKHYQLFHSAKDEISWWPSFRG